MFITADHVIVRYLRMRLGTAARVEADALGARHCRHLMIDHCSISWATDENASFYNISDATIQWCIISEALNASVHHKGRHGYGGIWGGRNVSFHHNLFAHNNSRNPRFDHPRLYWENDLLHYRGTVDFVNNVVYNWGMKAIYGGEEGWFNVIDNCFRPGPATKNRNGEFLDISTSETTSMIKGRFYIDGNEYDGKAVEDPRSEPERFMASVPLNYQSAYDAYKAVLKQAGASHRRDAIDRRIAKEVRKGTATYKGSLTGLPGIIDSENDVLK